MMGGGGGVAPRDAVFDIINNTKASAASHISRPASAAALVEPPPASPPLPPSTPQAEYSVSIAAVDTAASVTHNVRRTAARGPHGAAESATCRRLPCRAGRTCVCGGGGGSLASRTSAALQAAAHLTSCSMRSCEHVTARLAGRGCCRSAACVVLPGGLEPFISLVAACAAAPILLSPTPACLHAYPRHADAQAGGRRRAHRAGVHRGGWTRQLGLAELGSKAKAE
jgi:hypothetical protein